VLCFAALTPVNRHSRSKQAEVAGRPRYAGVKAGRD